MDNRADIFIDKLSTKPFRIVEEHAGGFGRVIIVQSGSPEKYALKTLKWELGADRNELLREATRHARLPNHPNVIEIFGAFWLEGAPYFIMPFCPGSLSDEMRRLGGISEAEVIKIVTSVASGLSFLHDKSGILHLDLKPQNILTTAAGEYVISDFGISKFFSREQSLSVNAALFVSGVSGTLAYMSPEHFVSKELSAKSDVWASG